jgi:hypothetical protein
MTYQGEFCDINSNEYILEVITKSGESSSVTKLTLGGDPFVTSMDASADTIYTPIKGVGATIGLIMQDYNPDFYSAGAADNRVNLYKNGKIEWIGFITPNLYDQPYDYEKEDLQLECRCAISALQDFKYEAKARKVKSFLDVIIDMLNKIDCYSAIRCNSKMSLNNSNELLSKLVISESNFFEEKDSDETDEDVAWSCYEVLEEICRYLSVTATPVGDILYLIDYDNQSTEYIEYDFKGNSNVVNVELNPKITAESYAESGTTLSLSEVYNKVTVVAESYAFEDVLPDLDENLENITSGLDAQMTNKNLMTDFEYGEIVPSVGYYKGNMELVVSNSTDTKDKGKAKYNSVFLKYCKSPFIKCYNYDSNKKAVNLANVNYSDTKTYSGAYVVKMGVDELAGASKLEDYYNNPDKWNNILASGIIDDLLAENDVRTVSFDDCILMTNIDYNLLNSEITSYPYFETQYTDLTALWGGDDAYLLISGDMIYHSYSDKPYAIPDGQIDIDYGRRYLKQDETYLVCKLQWGNLWWDGEEWVNSETTFKLPYLPISTSNDDRRADNTMFKDLNIRNTVNWRMGLEDEGYAVKLPSQLMAGSPKFTMYKPYSPVFNENGQIHKFNVVILKNFAIKALIANPTYSDDKDTDTVYSNIVNENSISELSEISMKIHSWDNKNPCYSAVGVKSGDNYEYLKALSYNDESMNPEEALVERIVNQYSTPSLKLSVNLKDKFSPITYIDSDFYGKRFIVDTLNHDYKQGLIEAVLIEKK